MYYILSTVLRSNMQEVQEVKQFQDKLILNGKWDLYYHLPHDKQWDISSYKLIYNNIRSLDELIALNENIPEKIVKHCMLFVMRNGITPMWEDVKNRDGGCFSFKVPNRFVHDVWKQLFYSLCGESLFDNKKYNKYVKDSTPIKKVVTISDVATSIAFLASEASSMITGTSIVIDGGWTAK